MSKLESCPICGGKAIAIEYYDSWLGDWTPVKPVVYACNEGHLFADVYSVKRIMKLRGDV